MELQPLISDMIRGDWLYPGPPGTHAQEVDLWQRADVDGRQGPHYEEHKKIREYFDENPIYVWFRDNGRAGMGDYFHTFFDDTSMQLKLTGTGLWKRARVCDLQGQAVGIMQVGWPDAGEEGYAALDGSGGYHQPPGLYIFLRVGSGALPSRIKYNQFYEWRPGPDPLGFFFKFGYDGILLQDTPGTAQACVFQNYRAIHNMKPLASELSTEQRLARLAKLGYLGGEMEGGELKTLFWHPWDLPQDPFDDRDSSVYINPPKRGGGKEGRVDTRDWVVSDGYGGWVQSGYNPGKILKKQKIWQDPKTGKWYGGNKGALKRALDRLRAQKVQADKDTAKFFQDIGMGEPEGWVAPWPKGRLDPQYRHHYGREGWIDPAFLKPDEWYISPNDGKPRRVYSAKSWDQREGGDKPNVGNGEDPWYLGITIVMPHKNKLRPEQFGYPAKVANYVKLMDYVGSKKTKREKSDLEKLDEAEYGKV